MCVSTATPAGPDATFHCGVVTGHHEREVLLEGEAICTCGHGLTVHAFMLVRCTYMYMYIRVCVYLDCTVCVLCDMHMRYSVVVNTSDARHNVCTGT